jgi:hypothetical protein
MLAMFCFPLAFGVRSRARVRGVVPSVREGWVEVPPPMGGGGGTPSHV